MAAVGGMLASAVIKETMGKLGSAIGGEVKLHWNFKRDLEELKDMLESIEAVLDDAERRSIKEKEVRLWLMRLKDASDDISDMVDEFETTTSRQAARKPFIKIFRVAKTTKINMAHKMKKMRLKLKTITEQHHNFSFKQGSCSSEQQVPDKRETSSNQDEQFIVGRNEEMGFILSCISQSNKNKTTILPIYGMGGIGKTTLARMVFRDAQFKDYSQVWVYVSQTFDLKKIGNSIISEVTKKESQLTTKQMIHNFLRDQLCDQKILIVLDDLWENDDSELKELRNMLKHIGNDTTEVIAIVTTRDREIADKFCTIKPYELPPLTDDMCWTIIKQKVNFEARPDKDRLEWVGREIAFKCGGVALAAEALGHMLRSIAIHKWESVRDSNIWNEFSSDDRLNQHHKVISSLMLSYNSMPPYLKLCFAYCATFTKGHEIVKDDLIYQWISLGFVQPLGIFSDWENGENCISHLVGMSFLQYAKSPSTLPVHHEDVTLLTMHDLVHDLARYVMGDEIFDASKQGSTGRCRYHFALLNNDFKPLKSFTHSPMKIRALRFLESGENVRGDASSSSAKYLRFLVCGKTRLYNYVFSSAKYLRVLDLSKCCIRKLPKSIGHLKQLRYLNAPGVQQENIPRYITNLSKLIYLSLRGSSAILTLPESIGGMDGLMYLDLSGCSRITKLPRSFGNLKKIDHLDLSSCSRLKGLSEFLESLTNLKYLNLSYCQNIGDLPGALGKLSEMVYLNLSSCSYIEGRFELEVLSTLTKLEYLIMSSQSSGIKRLPEALSSFINLKYLDLSGFEKLEELPTSFENLKSLMHLDLSRCRQVKGIPEALGGLTNLRYLNLSHCCNIFDNDRNIRQKVEAIGNLNKLQYLNLSSLRDENVRDSTYIDFFECINTLANLEHLDLSNNRNLYKVPDCFGKLRKLYTLNLTGCRNLRTIPASIGQNDSLKFVHTNACPYLGSSTLCLLNKSSTSLPHVVVQANDYGSSSNVALLQDVNTPKLKICCLENVKSIEEVQIFKLMEKQRIIHLKLKWNEDAERFMEDREVLGKLVPPTTVKEFKIVGYNCAKFPAWLTGIDLHLPNLVCITIASLPKCINLPPLGKLPNLKELTLIGMKSITRIDGHLCGGPRSFSRLECFSVYDMESLEVWNTTYSYGRDVSRFMFPNLRKLCISTCPKLRLTPCLPTAEEWEIKDSDGVISSWEVTVPDTGVSCSSPPVTTLKVISCKVPLHDWSLLHHLLPLKGLSIENCNDLTIPVEVMTAPSSLRLMTLESNDQAQISDCQLIMPLKALEVGGFKLQESKEYIKHLTSLQSLCLHRCESMMELPRWVGDLNSLQEFRILDCPNLSDLEESMGRLTSLRKLDIRFCKSIKSLPEGIQKLTNLEYLEIRFCPELKRWCELEDNRRKLSHVKEKLIW